MRELAGRLSARKKDLDVRGAFLSLSEPDLSQAVQAAADQGSREIRILPLFLFSGKHVLGDIPEQVEALRARHPDLTLTLLPAIGRDDGFADFLLQVAG